MRENEGSGVGDDSGPGRVSDRVPGTPFGEFLGPSGRRQRVKKESQLKDFAFSRGETRIRLTLNLSGGSAFRETTRERSAIIEGTFQDWAFPHENIEKSCCLVVKSGIAKGVLFGFR